MNFFVHPQGICDSQNVGKETRIWAFSHVLSGARIGQNCNVCDHVFIENDVIVGDNVTIKSGVQLWDGITIHDNVFIGPNATFTNDIFPRSKVYPEKFLRTEIHKNASIGANATILPGITIGQNAMVGAGAVVLKSVPPNAIVVGNPAKIVGYVNTKKAASQKASKKTEYFGSTFDIENGSLHEFPVFQDLRGSLSVGEFGRDVPFIPKRYFLVYDVASSEIRGEHAHKKCQQFLICVNGSCTVLLDDGHRREEIRLDEKKRGLYIPPMVWGCQYKYTPDAVLLVFASDYYDAEDYIRDYDLFVSLVNQSKGGDK